MKHVVRNSDLIQKTVVKLGIFIVTMYIGSFAFAAETKGMSMDEIQQMLNAVDAQQTAQQFCAENPEDEACIEALANERGAK